MKTQRLFFLALAGVLCWPGGAWAQGSYAIRNARIVTVSGPVIDRGTVVIQDGRITAVGERVPIPSGARTIDGRGLSVYPGLFDADTNLGLTEIGQVPVTNDFREMGEYMPHLLAFSALHVESEHIPVARVDGITHVLTRPSGGVLPGQAALISLYGWTPEEMEIKRRAALILDFPTLLPLGGRGFFGRQRSYSQLKREHEQKLRELKELLAKARHYAQAREASPALEPDKQLEALVDAVQGRQLVLIQADSHVDIQEAVRFAQEEKLKFALLGARDAWKVAAFLKENQVDVILGPRQSLPVREDDPIDIIYRTPKILLDQGVRFAISTGSSANVRTLPFEAGSAVAYGLPWEAALRSITLAPAEILGVADEVGSIEVGKRANLIVTDGDVLEIQTRVRHLFINGHNVGLESKHRQLYEKYINRP